MSGAAPALPMPLAAAPSFAVSRAPAWQMSFWKIAIFLALHVPLGLAMKKVPMLATLHGWVTVGIGLYWALSGRPREQVACAACYILGSEVLWRMTGARVLWEMGKYGMALLFLASMFRLGRLKLYPRPMLFFLLLVPSALFTLTIVDLGRARDNLSYNMSGPFSLAVSLMFFQGFRTNRSQICRIMASAIGPICAIGAIVFTGLMSSNVSFGRNSNAEASGGYGPNQVSSAFGFGLFGAVLCLLDPGVRRWSRLMLLGVALVFAAHSALTFSRTGLYLGVISSAILACFLATNRRMLGTLIGAAGVLAAVAFLVILPRLDAFTGGALQDRLKNTSTTGRMDLIVEDFHLFLSSPALGIGVGQSIDHHKSYHANMSAHTEFTRLLAEHGIFGALALVLLIAEVVLAFLRAKGSWNKAITAAFLVFALLYMASSGMRTALPAFTFGLAAGLTLLPPRPVIRTRDAAPLPA